MFSTLTRQNTYGLVFHPQPLRNVCLLKDNKTPATPLTSLSYQKKVHDFSCRYIESFFPIFEIYLIKAPDN